jgi:hypothetical protein
MYTHMQWKTDKVAMQAEILEAFRQRKEDRKRKLLLKWGITQQQGSSNQSILSSQNDSHGHGEWSNMNDASHGKSSGQKDTEGSSRRRSTIEWRGSDSEEGSQVRRRSSNHNDKNQGHPGEGSSHRRASQDHARAHGDSNSSDDSLRRRPSGSTHGNKPARNDGEDSQLRRRPSGGAGTQQGAGVKSNVTDDAVVHVGPAGSFKRRPTLDQVQE